MNGSVSGPRGVARLPTQQLVGPRLCLGAFPRRTLVVARGLCDGLWSLDGKLLPRRCRRTIVIAAPPHVAKRAEPCNRNGRFEHEALRAAAQTSGSVDPGGLPVDPPFICRWPVHLTCALSGQGSASRLRQPGAEHARAALARRRVRREQ